MLTEWNTVQNCGFKIRGKMALDHLPKRYGVRIPINMVLIDIAQIVWSLGE